MEYPSGLKSFSRWIVAAGLAAATTIAIPERGASAKSSTTVDLRHLTVGKKAVTAENSEGDEVVLTLDPALQKAAQKILKKSKAHAGAIVMSDVRTGRILVWASIGDEGDLVRKAKYPGASLFKVITAAALLEGKYVKPTQQVCFGGGETRLKAEDVEPGCHPGDKKTRFDKALGKSINGVFARLALKHLSVDEESNMARAFAIGDNVPFDLSSDTSSVKIPADDLGFARAAAGFGDAKLTPLTALFMMQTIANDGERIRLHVTGSPDGVTRSSAGRAITKDTATKLMKMLEVTTKSGTSKKAFEDKDGHPKVSVAGKTGTLALEKPKRLVSWFAGFAPSRNPEVAISVLLANDEKWWRKGNEVARDVLDAYFAAKDD